MPDENESNALAKIKGYLDSGHSLEEVRGAGWGSWIDHLEAIGYDVETARLRLEPPTEAVPQDMVMDAASSVGKVAAHQVILEEEITEVLNDPAVQAQLYVKTSNYPNEEARAARILEVEQTLVEIQVALDDWIGQFVEKTGCELCREWLAQPSTRHHYWLVTAEAEGLWAAKALSRTSIVVTNGAGGSPYSWFFWCRSCSSRS